MKVVREGLFFTLAATLAAAACNSGQQTVQTSDARGKSGIHGAYLIRNAALVLTMDPNVGQGMVGEMRDADVLLVKDHIQALGHHFNGQPDNVTWVFVAGRPLKARGKLVGVDERQLLRERLAGSSFVSRAKGRGLSAACGLVGDGWFGGGGPWEDATSRRSWMVSRRLEEPAA